MFQRWFCANVTNCMDDATCVQLFMRNLGGELTLTYVKKSSLFGFLKEPEIRVLEGIKTYIKETASSVVLNNDNLEDLIIWINFEICLHLPKISQGYVFTYSLYDNINKLRIFVNHSMDQYHLSSNKISDKKLMVYTQPKINEITKIALNLISNIYCFPECLVDGAPHDIKTKDNHYLKLQKIENVLVADLLLTFMPRIFQTISSDFYKNKKGYIGLIH